MGRIRTLKPEWLEDAKLGTCGSDGRLLSVGLILLADDYGNGRAHEHYLAAHVFTYENFRESTKKIRESLARLSDVGFVSLYEVDGEWFYHLTHWERHQRVDKPGKPRVPLWNPELSGAPAKVRETPAKVRETPAPDLGPRIIGPRIIGTELRRVSAEAESCTPSEEARAPVREVFEHWVASHGKRAGTKLDQKRKGKIKSRLREGFTVEQLKQAIDGCKLSEFHMANARYSDIATILRDATTTEGHIEALQCTDSNGKAKPRFEVPQEVHVFAAQKLSNGSRTQFLRQLDPHKDEWVLRDVRTHECTPTDWTTEQVLEAWRKAKANGNDYDWLNA